MGCNELLQLLKTDWRENETLSSEIAAHIRSCLWCYHGVVRLSQALIAEDPLNCDQCRARFPDYYEATRPDYPLVEMDDTEIAETAFHLSHCRACREQYQILMLLSELEERNEMVDL